MVLADKQVEQEVAEVKEAIGDVQVVEPVVEQVVQQLEAKANEVVKADEAQEAQEEQEELVVQEVQDHHSHHLSPDHAALALLAHRPLVVLHRQGPQGCPHRRGAGQRH